MRHVTLIARFLETPWALERGMLSTIASILTRWAHGGGELAQGVAWSAPLRAGDEADFEGPSAGPARRQASAGNVLAGGVAVIPVYGVIMQRADMLSEMSGAVSCQAISQQLAAAMADETVSSVLFDIDSPGGSVFGVQELADEINAAKSKKPIAAIANSLAASAAYWIGSQCSEFHVTPSGAVGSIGVYAAHEDYSKALADAGIKVTLVTAGKYKAEGSPYEPLDDDARAFMQSQVDTYYKAFTSSVARGRSAPVADVREKMGQGRVLLSGDAKAANMVDAVSTFGQVVKGLQTRAAGAAKARALARSRELDILSIS